LQCQHGIDATQRQYQPVPVKLIACSTFEQVAKHNAAAHEFVLHYAEFVRKGDQPRSHG
jgi:hypothetical protein